MVGNRGKCADNDANDTGGDGGGAIETTTAALSKRGQKREKKRLSREGRRQQQQQGSHDDDNVTSDDLATRADNVTNDLSICDLLSKEDCILGSGNIRDSSNSSGASTPINVSGSSSNGSAFVIVGSVVPIPPEEDPPPEAIVIVDGEAGLPSAPTAPPPPPQLSTSAFATQQQSGQESSSSIWKKRYEEIRNGVSLIGSTAIALIAGGGGGATTLIPSSSLSMPSPRSPRTPSPKSYSPSPPPRSRSSSVRFHTTASSSMPRSQNGGGGGGGYFLKRASCNGNYGTAAAIDDVHDERTRPKTPEWMFEDGRGGANAQRNDDLSYDRALEMLMNYGNSNNMREEISRTRRIREEEAEQLAQMEALHSDHMKFNGNASIAGPVGKAGTVGHMGISACANVFKENGFKENGFHENGFKENVFKENGFKENVFKENSFGECKKNNNWKQNGHANDDPDDYCMYDDPGVIGMSQSASQSASQSMSHSASCGEINESANNSATSSDVVSAGDGSVKGARLGTRVSSFRQNVPRNDPHDEMLGNAICRSFFISDLYLIMIKETEQRELAAVTVAKERILENDRALLKIQQDVRRRAKKNTMAATMMMQRANRIVTTLKEKEDDDEIVSLSKCASSTRASSVASGAETVTVCDDDVSSFSKNACAVTTGDDHDDVPVHVPFKRGRIRLTRWESPYKNLNNLWRANLFCPAHVACFPSHVRHPELEGSFGGGGGGLDTVGTVNGSDSIVGVRHPSWNCLDALCPTMLGPIDQHNQPDLPKSVPNLRNFLNGNRILDTHVDQTTLELNEKFFERRLGFYTNPEPREIRTNDVDTQVAIVCNNGITVHNEDVHGNAYSMWRMPDKSERVLDASTTRYITAHLYERLVENLDIYKELYRLVNRDLVDIQIFGLRVITTAENQEDAPSRREFETMFEDMTVAFGHEMILVAMLTLDKEDRPWRSLLKNRRRMTRSSSSFSSSSAILTSKEKELEATMFAMARARETSDNVLCEILSSMQISPF